MATPWKNITDKFFDMIEEDADFFNYYNLSDGESMELALQRAKSMLKEAITRISFECDSGVDFNDYYEGDDGELYFTADITQNEENLLASLTYESFLRRDIAKLRAFSHKYTPSDLQVFSPANDRRTFMQMYDQICQENRLLLDRYKSKDRLTGAMKQIDYESYEDE